MHGACTMYAAPPGHKNIGQCGALPSRLARRGIVCNPVVQPVLASEKQQSHTERADDTPVRKSTELLTQARVTDVLTNAELDRCLSEHAKAQPVELQDAETLAVLLGSLGIPLYLRHRAQGLLQRELSWDTRYVDRDAFVRLVEQLKHLHVTHKESDVAEVDHCFYVLQDAREGLIDVRFLENLLGRYGADASSLGLCRDAELTSCLVADALTTKEREAEDLFVAFGGTPGIGDDVPTGEVKVSQIKKSKHPFVGVMGAQEVLELAQVFCGDTLDFEEFNRLVYLPAVAVRQKPSSFVDLRKQLDVAMAMDKYVDEGISAVQMAGGGEDDGEAASRQEEELLSFLAWKYRREQRLCGSSGGAAGAGGHAKGGAATLRSALQSVGEARRPRTGPLRQQHSSRGQLAGSSEAERDCLRRKGIAMIVLANAVSKMKHDEGPRGSAGGSSGRGSAGDTAGVLTSPHSPSGPKSTSQVRTEGGVVQRTDVSLDSFDVVLASGITTVAKGKTFRIAARPKEAAAVPVAEPHFDEMEAESNGTEEEEEKSKETPQELRLLVPPAREGAPFSHPLPARRSPTSRGGTLHASGTSPPSPPREAAPGSCWDRLSRVRPLPPAEAPEAPRCRPPARRFGLYRLQRPRLPPSLPTRHNTALQQLRAKKRETVRRLRRCYGGNGWRAGVGGAGSDEDANSLPSLPATPHPWHACDDGVHIARGAGGIGEIMGLTALKALVV